MEEEHKKVRVVIAEHNLDYLKLLLRSLEPAVHKIEVVGTAENGDKAIDAVRAYRPDILIAEELLPIMGGGALAKALSTLCHTIVLYTLPSGGDSAAYLRSLVQKGARGALQKPLGPRELENAIISVAEQSQPIEQRYPGLASAKVSRPSVFSVWGGKAGDGKTSVAISVALDLSRRGMKVLLVDFDVGHGMVAEYLNVNIGAMDILQLLQEAPPWDKGTVRQYVRLHEKSGLSVIGSPFRPLLAAFPDTRRRECRKIIEVLGDDDGGGNDYDVVILCLPNQVMDYVLDLLRISDKILLVMRPCVGSLGLLYRAVETVNSSIENPIPLRNFGVVVNMATPPPSEDYTFDELKSRIEARCGIPVLCGLPTELEVLAGYLGGRQHLLEKPDGEWAKAIERLCEIILKRKLPSPVERETLWQSALNLILGGKTSLGGTTP